ncbi:MAG: cysteine--tRNA ligase [Pirellulaceae bacterium]
MAEIRVYNTLSKTKEPFAPVRPPKVGMYLCGPTVYKEAHIGHMVGPVIFDTIKRYLAYSGFEVTWVVNITDVDDKLIAESQRREVPMSQIAVEMTADYMANLKELGVNQIDYLPRATDHMDDIIEFIKALESKDFAYASGGDVFFDVARDSSYGQLSNRSPDEQQGGGGEAAAKKRSAADFALWKSAREGEPCWDSPWGKGRPGWHIECSAMSHFYLGETFDIHGGGLDLMFPHHENERAQSSCCHGAPMVKYWMHNGLMRAGESSGKLGGRSEREKAATEETTESVDEQAAGKISRSKGAGGLADQIRRHTGERIRFFLLRSHYRSTIIFGEEGLQEAATALEGFYRFFDRFEKGTGISFYELPAARTRVQADAVSGDDEHLTAVLACRQKYREAMDDDFNTGGASSQLFDLLRVLNKQATAIELPEQSAKRKVPAETTIESFLAWLESENVDAREFIKGALVLRELTSLLGLFAKRPPKTASEGDDDGLTDKLVHVLIELRKEARANKDFATSDAIRNRLSEIGVALLDGKEGTTWELQK